MDEEIIKINKIYKSVTNSDQNAKMTLISISKTMRLRYFYKKDNNYTNPPFGTIIDESLVSEFYEFYMVS